jgi:hypothetical protein
LHQLGRQIVEVWCEHEQGGVARFTVLEPVEEQLGEALQRHGIDAIGLAEGLRATVRHQVLCVLEHDRHRPLRHLDADHEGFDERERFQAVAGQIVDAADQLVAIDAVLVGQTHELVGVLRILKTHSARHVVTDHDVIALGEHRLDVASARDILAAQREAVVDVAVHDEGGRLAPLVGLANALGPGRIGLGRRLAHDSR